VIGFYPVPDTAKKVKYWYTKKPARITDANASSETVIEIPEEMQQGLTDYMLFRMYMKDQDQRSTVHLGQWNDFKQRQKAGWNDRNYFDRHSVVKTEDSYNVTDLGLI